MEKVLFMFDNYYPDITSNGLCCEKIMTSMQKQGYEIRCLTAAQYGDTWMNEAKGIINYHYKTAFHKNISMQIPHCGPFKKRFLQVIQFFFGKSEFLEGTDNYPLNTYHLNRNILNALEKVHAVFRFDTVVSVAYPIDGVYSAYLFCKKHPKIRLIPYFLDPFVDGRKHRFYSLEKSFQKTLKLERKIIDASSLVVTKKEHRSHYEKYYPNLVDGKIRLLGAPLLENRSVSGFSPHSPLHAVFAGSLWPDIRNPQYIIEVFKHIPEIVFDIYTPASKKWIQNYIGNCSNIVLHDKISHDEMMKILEQADILVNIGNTIENAVPGKIIEYLGYCKPIISTVSNGSTLDREMFSVYPLGLSLDEKDTDWDKIREQVFELTEKRISIDYKTISAKFWDDTPDAFIEAIKNGCC